MATQSPWQFNPELSEDRLSIIAEGLLDVAYDVEAELSTPLDDRYTRNTTAFGRSRQWIIQKALAREYPWLRLRSPGMDVRFTIGGVTARFFSDDPQSPKKPGFFRHTQMDQLFEATPGEPVLWRFVVDKDVAPESAIEVFFLGYNAMNEVISEWRYTPEVRGIHEIGGLVPAAVELEPAFVEVRGQDDEESASRAESA